MTQEVLDIIEIFLETMQSLEIKLREVRGQAYISEDRRMSKYDACSESRSN